MRHREEKRDENKEGATKSFHSFSPPRYSRGHEKFISRTCPLYPPLFLSLSLVATNLLPTSSKISPRRCFEKFVQRRIRRRGGGGWETTRERLFHAFSFSINAFYLHYGTFCFAPFFFLMILLSGCNRFNVYVDLDYFL